MVCQNISLFLLATASLVLRVVIVFLRRSNYNKATKCAIGFCGMPCRPWTCALFATPKNAPRSVHQFWGPDSDAILQLSLREIILAQQVEVLPGSRRPVGHGVEKRLPTRSILDLFQLLRQVEIIPANDAVLDQPLAGFGQFLVFFFRL